MDFRGQSALYVAIVALAVAVAVLLRARRSRLQLLFAILSINIFVWRGFVFLYYLTENTFWVRAEFIAACFIPLAALRFYLAFPENLERRWHRYVIIVDLLSFGFAGLATLTGLHESRVFGAVVLIYGFVVLYLCSYFVYRLYRRHRSEQQAGRLRYLFSGGFIATTLCLLDYLPTLGVEWPSLGNVALLIYLYLVYQAIIRHRLLDLNEFVGRGVVLGLLAAIIAGVYGLLVLWTGKLSVALLNSVIASLLIAIVFEPLRAKVEEVGGRILFREKYELEGRLNTLRKEMTNVIELSDLWFLILSTIEQSRRATHGAIYLVTEDGVGYALMGHIGPAPPDRVEMALSRSMVQRLRVHGEPIVRESVERELDDYDVGARRGDPDAPDRLREVLSTMENLNASVVIPLRSEETLLGFLCLQDERLREAYSPGEIELLRGVAAQAAITIENSKLYDRLKERDRLAALGEMAAGLAHEIRNPLGAIKGAAQYLSADQTQPDAEFLSIIVEEVNRLNHVVSQFLDYARPYKAKPTPVDVNDVLRKTLQLVSTNGHSPDVETSIELQDEIPEVPGDAHLLKQVFLNLALNALEAMPRGGKLTVRSQPVSSSNGSPDEIEVEFSDTGEGIPRKDLNSIFIPFYTTKERGTGLGLAICQRIVKGHGGTIRVRSRRGRGTTFTVVLPVEPGRA